MYIAYVLIAVGALFSLINWGTLLASWRSKRFVSAIPFLGALPLGCGLAIIPETRPYAWLALVADYSVLVAFIALPRIVYELWSTSSINLLHNFTNTGSDRVIAIKLFRRHVAVISAQFRLSVPCDDHGSRVQSLGMVGRWSSIESGFLIDGYGSDRHLLISLENGTYSTVEVNYPSDKKYRYDCLDGLIVQKQI